MKASDVHALDDQDLVEALKDAREEAFNLRFRHATGELENTAGLRRLAPRHGPPADRSPASAASTSTKELKSSEEEKRRRRARDARGAEAEETRAPEQAEEAPARGGP